MSSDTRPYSFQLPTLVHKANALSARLGVPLLPEGRTPGYKGPPSACIPEVGRLLQRLAASKLNGLIIEHGTGAGVGTAWLASGLPPSARLVSVELDPERANAVAELFRDQPNVEIRAGDWHTVLADLPPADLLFMDATPRQALQPENWDRITDLVKVGGQIVFDDLTPLELWPLEWQGTIDLKREFASSNPRVLGAEVRTTPITSALLITRLL